MISKPLKPKLLSFKENGRFGLKSPLGQIVVEPELFHATPSNEGVCVLTLAQNGTCGLFDAETQKVIRLEGWKSVGELSYGLLPIQSIEDPKLGRGYANIQGQIAIAPQFGHAGSYDQYGANVCSLTNSKLCFRIDREGRKRGLEFASIRPFHQDGRFCGARLGHNSAERDMFIINGEGELVCGKKRGRG